MRRILLIAVVVSLGLVPIAAAGRYGCDGPAFGKGSDIVGPEKIHDSLNLSRRDLVAWLPLGPIGISGVIGCDGKVHDLEFNKELPEELETRLRDSLGEWRFEPAHHKAKPITSLYELTLNPPATAGGGFTNAYGCGEPVKSSAEVVQPRRLRSKRALSHRDLEKWGPIEVSGMIGCDGKVHDLEIDKELPEKLETKLRKNVGDWRFQPATQAGELVAVKYGLVLNRPTRAN